MCSTPFGIIGILTLEPVCSRVRGSSAQRLSASSEFSLHLDGVRKQIKLVLNAFRHHRNSHARREGFRTQGNRVLNAFRHHRNSHKIRPCNANRVRPCSTPFGIIGILTPKSHRDRCSYRCAQRLSASSEFSPAYIGLNSPFTNVLNAFRHHRNSH